MKTLIILSLLLLSTFEVFGKNILPQTQKDLEKELRSSENVLSTYQRNGETFTLYGFKESKNSEATLFRTTRNDLPTITWVALSKNGTKNFNFPVKDIFVSKRDKSIFVLSEENIFVSVNNGKTFNETNLNLSTNQLSFEELAKTYETSSEYQFIKSQKGIVGINQTNDLPPMAPTVWDTVLWDTSNVISTTNITWGAIQFLHSRIAIDNLGVIHLVVLGEDNLLKYYRSTDFGETFSPFAVIADSIGGIYEIKTSGNYVYVYCGDSVTLVSNPKFKLFVSSDNGLTWNPTITIDPAVRGTFEARNDTVYDYQETGAGTPIWQSRSYDEGMSFEPYVQITDTVFASIQPANVETGGNTLLYTRVGNKTSLFGMYIYRSPDLGNTWFPPIDNSPQNAASQFPELWFTSGVFYLSQGSTFLTYNRSEDYGNTYSPLLTLCQLDSGCVVEAYQQINANNENVFTLWQDDLNYPAYVPVMRFSRDKGDNWSPVMLVSEFEQGVTGMTSIFSLASDDSLVYTTFTTVKPVPTQYGERKVIIRRGFYKYPFFSPNTSLLNLGLVGLGNQVDTSFTITNNGVIPLELTQFDFPSEFSSPAQLPVTIEPDSSFNLEIQYNPIDIGFVIDTLTIHTNQQIDNIKELRISSFVAVSVENENNLPNRIELNQNYPNPFNPETVINYQFPINTKAKITIFDLLGKEVKSWQLNKNTSNYGKIVWDGTDRFEKPVSSGVYLYRLQVGNESLTKKMMLLR